MAFSDTVRVLVVFTLLSVLHHGARIEARTSPYERTPFSLQGSGSDFLSESGSVDGLGYKPEEKGQPDVKPQRFPSYSYNPSATTFAASKTPDFDLNGNNPRSEFNPESTKDPESDLAEYKTRSYFSTETGNQYPTGRSRRTGKPVYRDRESDGENNSVSETRSTRHGMSDTRSFANGAFFYDLQGGNHGAAYTFHSRNHASKNQVQPAKDFANDEWDDEQHP